MTARCHHEWSPDYVCSGCGAIKYASAPLWAAEAKIASGPRGPWLALWTFADRDTVAPDPVYPSNAKIGQRAGGVTPRTVQRHLEALALAGWIRIVDSGGRREIQLAWGEPRADWAAEAVAEHGKIVAGEASDTTTISTGGESGLTDGASGLTPGGDRIVTHTLDNLGSTLETVPWTPEAPDPDASGAGSPMQGSETAQGHPCKVEPSPTPSEPADPRAAVAVQIDDIYQNSPRAARGSDPPSPSNPRRRRSPAAGQAALDIGAERPEPDAVAELLALHERLRTEALAHHGERVTALPKPTSKAGRSMASGIRAALKSRGEPWCRRMLEWRGRGWLDDASQLAWSTTAVWTKPSLEAAERRMGQPARASPPSRAPRLSAPPPGDAPEYVPSFKPGSENDPCETF